MDEVWAPTKYVADVYAPLGRTHIVGKGLFRGDEIFPILEEELNKRFPDTKFINYSVFGSTHGDKEHEVVGGIPAKLKQYGADAVISGMGC